MTHSPPIFHGSLYGWCHRWMEVDLEWQNELEWAVLLVRDHCVKNVLFSTLAFMTNDIFVKKYLGRSTDGHNNAGNIPVSYRGLSTYDVTPCTISVFLSRLTEFNECHFLMKSAFSCWSNVLWPSSNSFFLAALSKMHIQHIALSISECVLHLHGVN